MQVKGVSGVGFLSNIVEVSGGRSLSLALRSDGTVFAWGFNGSGGLGNGASPTGSATPVQVKGLNGVGFLSDIVAVSAGAFHCLALLSNGTVYSWGGNQHGQLGDNTTTDRHTPVQVKGVKNVGMLSNVVAVSANTDSSAALMSNGTVVAWGANGWVNSATVPPPKVPRRWQR